MKQWIAFWNTVLKDVRTYYLKPPNVSWGLIFPFARTGMFFIRSGAGLDQVLPVLPGWPRYRSCSGRPRCSP